MIFPVDVRKVERRIAVKKAFLCSLCRNGVLGVVSAAAFALLSRRRGY